MRTAPPAEVLVVDDDAGVRQVISTALGRVGIRPREAATGVEALDAAFRRRPAAVVLDVRLPGLSGYEVLHELRNRLGADLPIILISGERTESLDRVGGLLLGADDYVVKPFDPGELLSRVRGLLLRSLGDSPVSANGDSQPTKGLTRRELEVLNLLSEGLDQVEISSRLVISPKTVSTHIQRILVKLGVHSRAQAVAAAHQDGIVESLT